MSNLAFGSDEQGSFGGTFAPEIVCIYAANTCETESPCEFYTAAAEYFAAGPPRLFRKNAAKLGNPRVQLFGN